MKLGDLLLQLCNGCDELWSRMILIEQGREMGCVLQSFNQSLLYDRRGIFSHIFLIRDVISFTKHSRVPLHSRNTYTNQPHPRGNIKPLLQKFPVSDTFSISLYFIISTSFRVINWLFFVVKIFLNYVWFFIGVGGVSYVEVVSLWK